MYHKDRKGDMAKKRGVVWRVIANYFVYTGYAMFTTTSFYTTPLHNPSVWPLPAQA